MPLKTRIAPTPSGYLHIGNIFSFGITTAIAKKYGAKILLRIDDLDKVRANPAYVQDVFDTLNFLGIDWQEGPQNAANFEKGFSQMQRLTLYNNALANLRDGNLIYACKCSRIEFGNGQCKCRNMHLPFDTAQANWRLITDNRELFVKTVDGKTQTATLPAEMHDFIVRKKDSYPSYQLASIIDDLHYEIDLIVRGQDLWDSTLAQLFLADVLKEQAFMDVAFYHHALITDTSGGKLSKSAGDTSIKYLREHGETKGDILKEILSLVDVKVEAENWEDFTKALRIVMESPQFRILRNEDL